MIYYLNNCDPDDVHDVFLKIEASFNIRFTQADVDKVYTLGDLCDVIHHKINMPHQDSCTTQQAFYKLRNAIIACTGANRDSITPKTTLKDIVQDKPRLIEQIKEHAGIATEILHTKGYVYLILFSILIVASVFYFFSWQLSLAGFSLFVMGIFFADKLVGKEIYVKTLGDLAQKMAREDYIRCRRNRRTVNRNEINRTVTALFRHELDLDDAVLSPQASFR